jgi:type IV pilus assembly protein PilW
MHIKRFKYYSGFSLIELLVALVINIILLSALIAVFSSNVGHFNKVNNSDALNQQLESALQLMANDIRRAGYWADAKSDVGTGTNNNPFMAAGVDLNTDTAGCILFTYDYNKNNSLPSITSASDDERYGFRLNNQTLQARPPGAAFDCSAAANAWENVTNPGIVRITALTFTKTETSIPIGQVNKTLLLRSVLITITGQLTSDASVTKTLTQYVRIRNDKYVP